MVMYYYSDNVAITVGHSALHGIVYVHSGNYIPRYIGVNSKYLMKLLPGKNDSETFGR